MRVTEIRTEKLFGLFDHVVSLNTDERITIIHGPNGYGKTSILRMIAGLFNMQFSPFVQLPCKSFETRFDDGSTLSVVRERDFESEDSSKPSPSLSLRHSSHEPIVIGSLADWASHGDPASVFEDAIPDLERVDRFRWLYRKTGELLNVEDVAFRFSDALPYDIDFDFAPPDWLKELSESMPVHFIRANRLEQFGKNGKRLARRRERSAKPTVAVEKYARDLATRIQFTLGQYAELSQSLDRTFPQRVVTTGHDASLPEDEIAAKLRELEEKRALLTGAGLLDREEHESFNLPRSIDETKREVLSVYIEDAESKLGVFDDILKRIGLFTSTIRRRFQFKDIAIDRRQGMHFTSEHGELLPASSLSTGEQHEVVLLYEMLFKVSPNSLILINEPEISLHVAWQKQFIKDLKKITELADFDALIATHSPEIISDRWDLTVELRGPDA